jgi:hypothetical protein
VEAYVTSERLRDAILAVPFRPFTVRLADGLMLDVPDAGAIAHEHGSEEATVTTAGGGSVVCDIRHIVGLAYPAPAAP